MARRYAQQLDELRPAGGIAGGMANDSTGIEAGYQAGVGPNDWDQQPSEERPMGVTILGKLADAGTEAGSQTVAEPVTTGTEKHE